MNWTAFEIAVNVYQSLLCLYFLKRCVHIHRPSLLKDSLCVLALAGFLTLYLFFDIPFSDVAGALIHFVWLMSVSDDPWYLKAFWITLKEILIIFVAGMITQVFLLIVPSHDLLLSPGPVRLVFVIIANMALSIVFFTAAQMRSRRHTQPYSVLTIFFLLNFCILVAMEMLFALQVQDVFTNDFPFFAAYPALVACSILSIVLYYLMSHTAQKQRDAELSLSHARLTRQHQQMLTDMYTDFIARQHDFKHQLQTLDQLVKDGNAQAAQMHLNRYQQQLPHQNVPLTGCLAADALLTAKRLECEHQQITFHLNHDPLSRLPMDEVIFCSILGNLLDNAIEGTLHLPPENGKRWIRLTMNRVQDMFFIRCTNSTSPSALRRKDGLFLSSKQTDGTPHGYGIRNIQTMVEQFDGFCTFDSEDQCFIATVTVPYSK